MQELEHLWFRRRGYLHFDEPISLAKAIEIVSDRDKIQKRSFLPFISFEVKSFKIKKDKTTQSLEKKEKSRPIAYSSHIDSHIYAYYSALLSNLYELQVSEFDLRENVLAFRSLEKSNIEFAKDAFDKIQNLGECSAVALDLSGFFDNLDHQILKDRWCKIIGSETLPADHYAVFKSITKYSQVNKDKLYTLLNISHNNPKYSRKKICTSVEFRNIVRKNNLIVTNKTSKGVPQGSPISALLSNIYMFNFDVDMREYALSVGGFYYRYCDDMLFIVPLDKKDEVAGIAAQKLKELKVSLNPSKTERREFRYVNGELTSDLPLQYLGFIFDGTNIYLRSSSLARYSDRMKRGVKLAKATMISKNKIRLSKNEPSKPIFKKKIYARYSHFGKRNFLTYGYRAAKIMDSDTIRKQLKPLWVRLQKEIEK